MVDVGGEVGFNAAVENSVGCTDAMGTTTPAGD